MKHPLAPHCTGIISETDTSCRTLPGAPGQLVTHSWRCRRRLGDNRDGACSTAKGSRGSSLPAMPCNAGDCAAAIMRGGLTWHQRVVSGLRHCLSCHRLPVVVGELGLFRFQAGAGDSEAAQLAAKLAAEAAAAANADGGNADKYLATAAMQSESGALLVKATVASSAKLPKVSAVRHPLPCSSSKYTLAGLLQQFAPLQCRKGLRTPQGQAMLSLGRCLWDSCAACPKLTACGWQPQWRLSNAQRWEQDQACPTGMHLKGFCRWPD